MGHCWKFADGCVWMVLMTAVLSCASIAGEDVRIPNDREMSCAFRRWMFVRPFAWFDASSDVEVATPWSGDSSRGPFPPEDSLAGDAISCTAASDAEARYDAFSSGETDVRSFCLSLSLSSLSSSEVDLAKHGDPMGCTSLPFMNSSVVVLNHDAVTSPLKPITGLCFYSQIFCFLSFVLLLPLMTYPSPSPAEDKEALIVPEAMTSQEDPVDEEVKGITERKATIGGELLLELDDPLSQGRQNVIYRGTYRHQAVAVKVSLKAGSTSEAAQEPLEVKFLRILHHPQILKLVVSGSYVPLQIRSRLGSTRASNIVEMPYETLIVTEYCDRGTLHQVIKTGGSVSVFSGQIATCALEIARAMAHMHSKRIIHGALHPKHIFLQSDPADPRGFVCKVGGFGSSLRLSHGSMSVQCNSVQSVTTAAPELLKSGMMSFASDVYAFGLLLYTMCVHQSPFSGLRGYEIYRLVLAGERPVIPKYVPTRLANLIRECWSPCFYERPTFAAIVERLEGALETADYDRSACSLDEARPSPLDLDNIENLVPGRRYACINFQPMVQSKRQSPTLPPPIDHAFVADQRQSRQRRTKSCITSFGLEVGKDTSHEQWVRQVDALIKRSRKTESRAELRQFLGTLTHN